jgi:hypothetical protein
MLVQGGETAKIVSAYDPQIGGAKNRVGDEAASRELKASYATTLKRLALGSGRGRFFSRF